MSLEPSVDSSPSGQGPVPWERQERDRILSRGYVRGERGGLDWATSPQSAISSSSRNIDEVPAITCMPGPGLQGECLHSLSSGAHSLAAERNRERGAFTRGKSRARKAPGSQGLEQGLPHLPRNGRSFRPQDAPLVLLPTSLPLPKLSFCPQQHLPRGEPSGPQPRERRGSAHCREKRPALWTLSPEAAPSEGLLQSLSSATLGPSSAPDPVWPQVQPQQPGVGRGWWPVLLVRPLLLLPKLSTRGTSGSRGPLSLQSTLMVSTGPQPAPPHLLPSLTPPPFGPTLLPQSCL